MDSTWIPPGIHISKYMIYMVKHIPCGFHVDSMWIPWIPCGFLGFHVDSLDSMWIPWIPHGINPFHMDSMWNKGGMVKYCNFQPCPKTTSNNINQLGLVNHHLVHSCLKTISNNIIQLGLAGSHPLSFFYSCLLYCCQSYLCFFSFISTPLPVVTILTHVRETMYIVMSRLGTKTQKGVYDFGTIIVYNI